VGASFPTTGCGLANRHPDQNSSFLTGCGAETLRIGAIEVGGGRA
jgi:hypothetical protein